MFTTDEIAGTLDATNLKLDASTAEIEKLCQDALAQGVAAVCVYPGSVARCRTILGSGDVGLAAVVGFPSGRFSVASKITEIDELAAVGASEVDIVLNYPALIAGETQVVAKEAKSLADTCRKVGLLSKFIVETCYLNREQKLFMLKVCEDAGANFIKTSTGFGNNGAQLEDIELWVQYRKAPALKIKASGGIRTRKQVISFLKAGVSRIGLSSAATVLSEQDMVDSPAGKQGY